MDFEQMKEYAEKMLPHYLECAKWSTSGYCDNENNENNELESLENFEFSENAEEIALLDCLYFVRIAYPWLRDVEPEQCGHDFWLSREGHGTGFFDRDYQYKNVLQEKAESMKGSSIYLDDRNNIQF